TSAHGPPVPSHYLSPVRPLHSFPTRRSSDLLPGGRQCRTVRRHDARVCGVRSGGKDPCQCPARQPADGGPLPWCRRRREFRERRSEEHTSELQSRGHLVCRLLLEKKKKVPGL